MLSHWTRNNNQFLSTSRTTDLPRVTIHLPVETECTALGCGWDAFGQSAKLTGCSVCEGKGKVTTWQVAYMRARITWASAIQFNFFSPTPGVNIGDVMLTISPYDKATMERVVNTARAYLQIDDQIVRPSGVLQKLDVPNIGEEYQIGCNLYNPNGE
jgi:hypothetical protein